jgi:IS30 family transposase
MYQQLTCLQRCQTDALKASGHSNQHIAQQIGVHPSTISRELRRNSDSGSYHFDSAHLRCFDEMQRL